MNEKIERINSIIINEKIFIERYINSIEINNGCNRAWLKYYKHINCQCGSKLLIYNYISHCYSKKHLQRIYNWL